MIKLTEQDIMMMLNIIENTQFSGRDVMAVSDMMKKLMREMEKLNPTFVRNNGKE